MPSKTTEDGQAFSTIYKRRGDREAQASITSRRRSVRNERQLRKDEQMDHRRGLSGMSALSEFDNTLDQDQDSEFQTNVEQESKPCAASVGSKATSTTATSRVLSIKERLQKWREEKKKQLEMKKKQAPAFVVKNLEYKSDSDLYSKAPKTAKKVQKPEGNFNFAENAKERTTTFFQKNGITTSKQDKSAPKRTQPLKIPIDTEMKQKVATRTQTTRITRQAVKTENPKGKPEEKKTLATKNKSLKDLHSTAQESKPKAKPVKGDLHLRLTAAAAAKKQENADKPKEFLRAKPHHFTGGRTTRSHTKQAKSQDDFLSIDRHPPPSQPKKLPGQGQTSTHVADANIEVQVSTIVRESPEKSNRQTNAEKLVEYDKLNESNDSEYATGLDDQSGKEKSATRKQLRRSLRFVTKEANVDEPLESMEVTSSSETKNFKSLFVLSDGEKSNEGMEFTQFSTNSPKNKTPRKSLRSTMVTKSGTKDSSMSSSEEEHFVSKPEAIKNKGRKSRGSEVSSTPRRSERKADFQPEEPAIVDDGSSSCDDGQNSTNEIEISTSEDKIYKDKVRGSPGKTPGRKSRRSKISSINDRTPRRSVGKAFYLSEEEPTIMDGGSSSCEDGQKSTNETEVSTFEDKKWKFRVRGSSSKRTRKSIGNATMIKDKESDQVQEEFFSPKRAKLAVDRAEASPDEKEITNLAVVFTPGKSEKRSVFKVLPVETELATKVKVDPTHIERNPKAVNPNAADTVEELGLNVGAKKSFHSEKKIKIDHTKWTPRRKSEYFTCGSAAYESQICSELDTSCSKKEIVATPVRKSRRSAVTPMTANTLFQQNTISYSSLRATSHTKSWVENFVQDEVEQAEENVAKEQSQEDLDIADTQMSPDVNCTTEESRQNIAGSFSSKAQHTPSSRTGNKGSKRRSGKKTPKSGRRPSCSRARSSTPSFSPLARRCKSTSTVVSVSQEGTSSLKGTAVVEQAVTPNSSFAENSLPVNELTKRKSARRSAARSAFSDHEETSNNSVYRLAKLSSNEAEAGPLQEITVEKVEGETSYIEVPMDVSETSIKNTSLASTPSLTSKETLDTDEMATEEPNDLGSSSSETEPFTPRKSCNMTKSSQDSMPSVEATPDLPPRVPVRQFKTPFQAPPSAHRVKGSSTRLRCKTVHSTPSKSPEEMIKILQSSPMIEMTRRRSRHVSSPAPILPLDLNLNAHTSPMVVGNSSPKSCVENIQEALTSPSNGEEKTAATTDLATLVAGSTSETNLQVDPQVMERVLHFRNILISETKRLNELCKTWEETAAYTFGISEDNLGQIRTTVGKAQLLIDQRFKQFSGLVHNCEFNLGEQKTRPEDLQGFWEMIYFQVEEVNGLFDQLKVLQDNNWEKKKSPPKMSKKKLIGAKGSKPKGVSNFKAFRREMMLRKAQKTASAVPQVSATTEESAEQTMTVHQKETGEQKNLEFDGIFFKVTSPARTAKGKRATLVSQANSPTAEMQQEDAKPNDETICKISQSSKLDSTSTPLAANKENEDSQQESFTPATYGAQGNHQVKRGMSSKRLSYLPVIPSPLLKDTTGITTSKKN